MITKTTRKSWGVNLNGTTQYMSKTSPTNLDLNDVERITSSADRDFSSTPITWAGYGNHSVAQSSVDKHAGTYSLAMTSTAAGDATTNYAMLPSTSYTNFGQDANGVYEKYTVQLWARATNIGAKITINIGSQSKQSATLSIIPGTFTLCPFNFQTTASEIAAGIKVYSNQADVIYIDDVSITKAYDGLLNVWIKSNNSSTNIGVIGYSGIGLSNNFLLRFSTGNQIVFETSDGVTRQINILFSWANYSDGKYHLVTGYFNHSGTSALYIDGVLKNSGLTSNLGVIYPQYGAFTIGQLSNLYFTGQIGETQITRFTDIVQSNINTTTLTRAYQLGIPTNWLGGSPQIVAEYKFRGDTDAKMLVDKSTSTNNLAGVNVSQASNQVAGTYPTRFPGI